MSERVLTEVHWGDEHATLKNSLQRLRVTIDSGTSLLTRSGQLTLPTRFVMQI
jgi:hypothetical protein